MFNWSTVVYNQITRASPLRRALDPSIVQTLKQEDNEHEGQTAENERGPRAFTAGNKV